MNDQYPVTQQPVIVGAGPTGCTAALLLADFGIPVTLLERHTQPHPLPRAVHLDEEVARILDRIGVSEEFLARSRPGSGLRLLDARHRVMAEFRRDQKPGVHGFPQANMFHQPDLEELLFARVEQHPLIDLRRGAEVCGLDGASGPLTADPVRVHARIAADMHTFTSAVVLGCDGAGSTVRELAGITMDDLCFSERWLVVDIRAGNDLNTWDGVEQICDPARAATFMHVTGDRYRWEFRLLDGEDETGVNHGNSYRQPRDLRPRRTARAQLAGGAGGAGEYLRSPAGPVVTAGLPLSPRGRCSPSRAAAQGISRTGPRRLAPPVAALRRSIPRSPGRRTAGIR